MPYIPTSWINGASPPINAANLNNIETGIANSINKDGSVAMTAGLTLAGNPTLALQATPKQYVDGISYLTAGSGLTKVSSTINIGASTGISVNADDISLATVSQGGTGGFLKVGIDAYGRVFTNSAVGTSDISALIGGTILNSSIGVLPSGTGLGGGGTFTLNQTTNQTITISSNATSANTGGAIVARDANGDFSARIITGSTFSGGASLTGSPIAPTPATDNNSTSIATTAYVLGQASGGVGTTNGTASAGSSTRWSRADHVHPSDPTKLNLSGGTLSGQLQSTVSTGTAPFIIASTTGVTNLNADLLDGQQGTYYLDLTNATNTLSTTRGGLGLSSIGTANQILGVNNAAGGLEYKTVSGTNVTITNAANSLAISIPQSVATGATPTFAQISITNTPSADGHAATKSYVDSVAQGLRVKQSVRVATTTNLPISAGTNTTLTLSSGVTILDGITLATNDRILVKDQTGATQNGLYVYTNSTTLTRSTDADNSPGTGEVVSGIFTFVEEGASYADSGWILATPNPITLGTTGLTFSQFSAAGQITAGTGMVKNGNVLDVVGTAGTIVANANSLDLATVTQGGTGAFRKVGIDSYGRVFTNSAVAGSDITSALTTGTGMSISNGIIAIANTGVGTGTYRSVTVNAQGQVTSGTNPTNLAGYGITDAIDTSATTQTKTGSLSIGGTLNSSVLRNGSFTLLNMNFGAHPEVSPSVLNPVAFALTNGKPLYEDNDFAAGNNSISIYDNASSGQLSYSRVTFAGVPNNSGHVLEFTHTGVSTTPGLGGFFQTINTERNATYVQIFKAKIPTGYNLSLHSNAMGSNATEYWMSNSEGTGEWETYVRVVQAGTTGTFNTTGFVALNINGGAAPSAGSPLVWQLASCNAYEISSFVDSVRVTGGNITGGLNVAGNIGVGTTSPLDKLHVNGNVYLGTANRTIYTSGSGNLTLQTGTGQFIIARNNAADTSMQINSSGNVGIGTASPNSKLEINGAIASFSPMLRLFNSGVSSGYQSVMAFYANNSTSTPFLIGKNNSNDSSGSVFISNQANTDMIFETNGTERMRVLASGNVGIGVTNPTSAKLVIKPDTNASGLDIIGATTSAQSFGLKVQAGTSSADYAMNIRNAALSANLLYVRGDGNIGIGTSTPTAKLEVAGGISFSGTVALSGSAGASGQVLLSQGTGVAPIWATVSGVGGAGTVTSVAATVPSILTVSGTPVTTSGTFAFGLANQNANLVFAGPASGAATTPTFRSLAIADIPSLGTSYLSLSGGTLTGGITLTSGNLNVSGGGSFSGEVRVEWFDIGTGAQTTSNIRIGNGMVSSTPGGFANVAIGDSALLNHTSGGNNTGVGTWSLRSTTSGTANSGFGSHSLTSNTTGSYNVAVGNNSLYGSTNTSYNIGIGYNALYSTTNTASNLVAIGVSTLVSNTSGATNTAIGYHALRSNTSGNYNLAIGPQALMLNTTGSYNVGMGHQALYSTTTNSYQSAFGANALNSNTGSQNTAVGYAAINGTGVGSYNSALGSQSLLQNTSGAGNNAIGYFALRSNTSGDYNIGLGYQALYGSTNTSNNIAIGANALYSTGNTASGLVAIGSNALGSNTTGFNNVAIGYLAADANTTGNSNTAIGYNALGSNTTGSANTAIGNNALQGNISGTDNFALGYNALWIATGSANIAIGSNAGSNITTGANNTIIGSYSATSTLSGTVVLAAGTTERLKVDSTGAYINGSTYAVLSQNNINTSLDEIKMTISMGGMM